MPKLVIITDPESAQGFRLAGVEVAEAKNPAEAQKHLISLINDDTSGIIAVSENLMGAVDEQIREKIDKIYRPIVVPIPSQKKLEMAEAHRKYLAQLIRRAVGFDIRLREK